MYTPAGVILFDVPVGLVLLWFFHTFVKWPVLSLLPENLQSRLYKSAQGFSFGPLKHFGLILLSLLVGSLTHVIWDSFTHEYGWVVENFAIFHTPIRGIPLIHNSARSKYYPGYRICTLLVYQVAANCPTKRSTAGAFFRCGPNAIFCSYRNFDCVG